MYAADHARLFAAPAAASREHSTPLALVDYDALVAHGRAERSRQFARMFDQASAAVKRLFH